MIRDMKCKLTNKVTFYKNGKPSISNHYKRKYRRVFKGERGFFQPNTNHFTQTATQGGFLFKQDGQMEYQIQITNRLKSNTAQ